MNLPVEMRLMVYERLPRQVRYTKLMDVILVTRHLPLAILRMNRQVYAGSHTIMSRLVRDFVQESQPKVIGSDTHQSGLRRLLTPMMNERRVFQVRAFMSHKSSQPNQTH
jgi:hypothetical protein